MGTLSFHATKIISSAALRKTKVIKQDYNNPMNGIFKYIKQNGFPDPTNSQIIFASSSVHEPAFREPSCLIDQKEDNKNCYAQCNTNPLYFDIWIPGFEIYITGYGLMSHSRDDEAPRSWNLTCLINNETIDTVEYDDSLCPDSTYGQGCGKYDKKSFIAQNQMTCNHIRFTQLKGSLDNHPCLSLAGFELFGSITSITTNMCTNVNRFFISFAPFLLLSLYIV